MLLFDRILASRGIDDTNKASFLFPDYKLSQHDPFLLCDMEKAVERIILAINKNEKITIYGDYDIDGLTAVALLRDALIKIGLKDIQTYIPNRFEEGYGLSISAIENIKLNGSTLIITVDCGSRSDKEIEKANQLGVDIIVTDHHIPADIQPPALAVINPKRIDNKYPFRELAGVGVAFKLVQALQIQLNNSPSASRSVDSGSSSSGLPFGQEKWLLDLLAIGTVCDVVPLIDENRTFVYWGLSVLKKTKRLGLISLINISNLDFEKINSRSLGYVIGPRMNASGRLETAKHSLDLLITNNANEADQIAQYLESLNLKRRFEQDKIFKEACEQYKKYQNDSVIVVSSKEWSHGIVGIVASKLLEKYHKPALVIQELGDNAKGSARSFGDFNIAKAIDNCRDLIISGGGHSFAAGITLPFKNIDIFRKKINKYYLDQKLKNQELTLLPKSDTIADLSEINIDLVLKINSMEPFGYGNDRPVLQTDDLLVVDVKKMGNESQHVKMVLCNKNNIRMSFLAFSVPEYFFVKKGQKVSVRYNLELNEWNNVRSVEGKILHIEVIE